ncbi:MAG: hypothetical protein ACI8PZ_001216 [Myxococcota bacterium]|jgi:hypothetical protein
MWLLLFAACVRSDPQLDTAVPDDAPVAAFTWEAGCDLVPVIAYTSTSEATSGDLNQLLWTFGDGSSGFGDLVIHRYAEGGAVDVALTAVDDEGRERTARQTVEAVSCLEVTAQEVTVGDGTADPVAVVANVGADDSARVEFRIDLLSATGEALVEDLDGGRAVVAPDSVVVARPTQAWECGDQCADVADMRVRLTSTFWFPLD